MDQNQSVLNEDRDNVQLVETDDAFPTLDAMLPWEMVVPNELLVPPHAEAPSPEYQASASLPWEPVNSVELRFTPPPRREVNLPSWLKPEEATSALALSGGALLAMIDLDSLVEAESRAFSPNRQSSDDDPVQRTLWGPTDVHPIADDIDPEATVIRLPQATVPHTPFSLTDLPKSALGSSLHLRDC